MADTIHADPRLDPAILPGRTAIILIDLQNDIIRNPNGAFYGAIAQQVKERQVVEKVVRLAHRSRAAGALIFYITVVRRKDYADVVNQINEFVASGKAPAPKQQVSLVEGTRGAQLVDELTPMPGDYVLVKKRRSAFFQTELDFHLRARNITTLAIGGVATDLGVENTVREAWDRDYNVVVLEDISVAVPSAAHDYAITSVFPRMARIMTTDQILAELEQHRGR